jgi:hypothetical protein
MRLHLMRGVTGSRFAGIFLAVMIAVFLPTCLAQDAAKDQPQEAATADNQLAVNWLYGAYVPKDAPLIALMRRVEEIESDSRIFPMMYAPMLVQDAGRTVLSDDLGERRRIRSGERCRNGARAC